MIYRAERSITRAEFAAVMVRALGLGPEEYKNDFSMSNQVTGIADIFQQHHTMA